MTEDIKTEVLTGGVGSTPTPFSVPSVRDDSGDRQYVINANDGSGSNVLISAAAGTGKTKTLVDRIVEKTKKLPADRHIDSFAVVTFTRAAASELAVKIGKALEEAAEGLRKTGDTVLAEKLDREVYMLPKAMIGTIDAFCLEVVRKNFTAVESSIDSSFAIDDDIVDVIRKRAVETVLEEYYSKSADDPKGRTIRKILTACKAFRDDSELTSILLEICSFCDDLPDPKAWLEYGAGLFTVPDDIRDNDIYKALKKEYEEVLKECRDHLAAVIGHIDGHPEEYAAYAAETAKHREWFLGFKGGFEAELLRLESESEPFPALFNSLPVKSSKAPGSKIKADDPVMMAKQEHVRARLVAERETLRKYYKESYEAIVKPLLKDSKKKNDTVKEADLDPEKRSKVFREGIGELGEYVSLIAEIALKVYEKTLEDCAARKTFSFSAISHFALEILCGKKEGIGNDYDMALKLPATDVAKAYRRRFDEIYIDEYQDTSLLQEFILTLVSRTADSAYNYEHNMIMVGDVKQSIYAFRNTKPELMLAKIREYGKGNGGVLKTLSKNFRSRQPVLSGINDIFAKMMTANASDIDYANGGHVLAYGAVKRYSESSDGADALKERCELIFLPEKKTEKKENTDDQDNPGTEEAAPMKGPEREALFVACKIRELFEKGFTVSESYRDENNEEHFRPRPLRYGDICIIANNNKSLAAMSGGLGDYGLPSETFSTDAFFETPEIYDILNFVQIIDNPRNDVPLAAVLRSAFFGFNFEELTGIVAAANGVGKELKHADLWERIVAAAERSGGKDLEDAILTAELQVKIKETVEKIRELREFSENTGTSAFVWKLINFNGYYEKCGNSAKGNLRMFLDFSLPFDTGISGGFCSFVRNIVSRAETDAKKSDSQKLKGYAVASDDPDKIRFMTVHKSKGLEFPVVFYVATNVVGTDRPAAVRCDEKLGIGLTFSFEGDSGFKKIAETAPNILMNVSKKEEERKEKQRVIYVALTRAREKLFVVASHKSNDDIERNGPLSNELPLPVMSTLASKACLTGFEFILKGALGSPSWDIREYSEDELLLMAGKEAGSDTEAAETLPAEESEKEEPAKEEPLKEAPAEETGADEPEHDTFGESVKAIADILETANAGVMPVKISVSALKRYAEEEGENIGDKNVFSLEAREFPSPSGEMPEGAKTKSGKKPKKLKGAALGTLMHKIMKIVVEDRGAWPEREAASIRNYVEETLKKNIHDETELLSADREMVERFLMSDRAEQIRGAEKVRCEVPFTFKTDIERYLPYIGAVGTPAKTSEKSGEEAGKEAEGEAQTIKSSLKRAKSIALQGVVDLYYKFRGRIYVVDFKTDNEKRAADPAVIEAYKLQLRCYRDALETISGNKVEECLLFFLKNGEETIVGSED